MARAMFEGVFKEMFPFWDTISENDRDFICNNTAALTYPKGNTVHDGNECSGVIFIKKGCLRVYIMSDEGKDITLYRLHSGEMCMLSASCVLQTITFDVFVDAEEDSECYVIAGKAYSQVANNNADVKIFRRYVGYAADSVYEHGQTSCYFPDRRSGKNRKRYYQPHPRTDCQIYGLGARGCFKNA